MHVIPVIDLQGGVAVRATGGERAAYKPIVTPLSPSPDPVAVAKGLLDLYPFDTLYVADLDALQGGDVQREALARLRASLPSLDLWIDCGVRTAQELRTLQELDLGHPILASESLEEPELLRQPSAILSLDFKGDTFLGRGELLEKSGLWPPTVIVMSLQQVGSGHGPDAPRLRDIVARHPGGRIYAAGGVRGLRDLEELQKLGAAGALVSSALHSGALAASELISLGK